MIGARRAMAAVGREVPLQVQVTIELTGRMLLGTEIGGALTALDAMAPDIIGINCATGPVGDGRAHPLPLAATAAGRSRCCPTPGSRRSSTARCTTTSRRPQLCEHHKRFVEELGVAIIGGCCGTTPEYIKLLVDEVRGLEPARRQPTFEPGLASIYSHVPYDQSPSFLVVGERTNANGSKKFREAMLDGDWDTTVAMAAEQVKEGSHVIDVCVDYVGRDGTADMAEVASRFATAATVPLMVDSTEPDVVETALQRIGGKAILNSVNLEDGDAPGTRLDRFLALAKEYGAAVVATCIDEEGQARTPEWKLRAARAIYDIAVDRYGLEPQRHLLRPPRPHPRHGHRGEPRRRHVHHRGHPRHQGGAARRRHHPRPLQHQLRPQPGRPPGAQLGVPARVPGGRPRRRHRPRRPHRADQPAARGAGADLPRPRSTTAGARRPRARAPATTPSPT